ncbi:efflux transporter outer membrane subunit [Opitutaceae bacterium TAV3]|nr:efflux transporter outer membrane subunit [Opitutaceae bacterium TAV3]
MRPLQFQISNSAKLTAAAATTALLLAGCSLAPKYERPASPVPDAWPTATPATPATTTTTATDASSLPEWSTFFGDPRLQALIQLGLDNNRDLRTALLRVEQTRAQYQIQNSTLWPNLNGSAGMTRARTAGDFSPATAPHGNTGNQFTVGGALATWEIDLFGRIRNLKTSALETYFATEQARRAAQLSYISTLASQYLTERSTAEQLALGRQTLQLVQDSHDLIKHRFDKGVATELDLRTAESQVAATRATIAEYTRLHAQALNALAYLVAAPIPDTLPPPPPPPPPRKKLLTDLPAGLPSDLLQRRPDILQAEHLLRASNADIGAARAAFFPSITLTAFGGTSSAQLSDLFSAHSAAWNFSPQITLPIFTAGRNRATLEIAQLQKQIEIATYEKTIQIAFREVADGLAARASYDEQLAAQQAQVAATQARYNLSDARYKGGVADYLAVLTAQQDLFNAQQNLIRSQTLHYISLVDLYRALGGGWNEEKN